MEATVTVPRAGRRITALGIAGLVIALLALAAAALSPWVVSAIEPQRKPIDQVAAETAGRIKDRLVAKAKGQEYIAPAEAKSVNWSKRYAAGVIAAGVLAISIGVVGLVARYDRRLGTATIAVGASAIVMQYAVVIAGVLLLILLIWVVLATLGGGA